MSETNAEEQPQARPARKVPRYRAVGAALRQQVARGELEAGSKLPALHELADRFKVSTHTVRCAIRVLEQEGCLHRVPDVGAFVQQQSSVRTVRSTAIALVTIDIGGAFELGIARGIERACRERGLELQIYDSRGEPQAEEESLRRLHQNGIRGAIILPTGSHDNIESLFRIKLDGIPIVLIDRGIPGLKADLVESAHESGGYLATKYLLDRGHAPVFMLTEPPGVSSIRARISGYDRALREAGLEPRHEWKAWIDPEVSLQGVRENRRWLGGYQAAVTAMRSRSAPLAFFALHDYAAWGLCKACAELDLRVPDDISIVCFDDSDITRAMHPPLTVIAQPVEELGKKAVEVLARRLEPCGADTAPEVFPMEVHLIERESVRYIQRLDSPAPFRPSPAGPVRNGLTLQ